MFGYAMQTVAGALALVLVVVSVLRKGNGPGVLGPILVLRRFEVTTEGSPAVLIEGRPSGLVSWILTSAGLETLTVFMVTGEQIRVRRASLSGESHHVAPTTDVSSTQCGYSQPFVLLIVGAIAALFSFLWALYAHSTAAFTGGLLVALVCALIYALQRTMFISVETTGGDRFGVAFKPSVIEGVNVNLPKALQAVARINAIVIARAAEPR